MRYRGLYPAIVTPFKEDTSLDIDSYKNLLSWQLKSGIDGVVVLGTTGESATTTSEERACIISETKKCLPTGSELIVGCGTNNTAQTIDLIKSATEHGATTALVVTPYYSKPSQQSIIEHYKYICAQVEIPILLYNIPSRTGTELTLDTISELSKLSGIVGIKHSTDSAQRIFEISCLCSEEFELIAGSDEHAYICNRVGGSGVISASANVIPDLMKRAIEGCFDSQKQALPIIETLFSDTNPAPAKYALEKMKVIESGALRLPLTYCAKPARERIDQLIQNGAINAS